MPAKYSSNLSRTQIGEDIHLGRESGQRYIAIIGLAATEQHGPFLPMGTDWMLTDAVIAAAMPKMEALGVNMHIYNTLRTGSSIHHRDSPGTRSHRPRAYSQLVENLVIERFEDGYDRVMLVIGHGGNIMPAGLAMQELIDYRAKDGSKPLAWAIPYWACGDPERYLKDDPLFSRNSVGHGGEWETSGLLASHPDLVDMEGMVAAPEQRWETRFKIPGIYDHQIGLEEGTFNIAFVTGTWWGTVGDSRLGTAEKGEKIIRIASDGLADKLQAFHDADDELLLEYVQSLPGELHLNA